ncbi:MAG: VWA domain-containing protein [Synergistaceae bacterium]|nr:VWA domain-containing protein [Synergistaceae bacterium]
MKKVSLFLFTVFCAAFFAAEAFSITVPPPFSYPPQPTSSLSDNYNPDQYYLNKSYSVPSTSLPKSSAAFSSSSIVSSASTGKVSKADFAFIIDTTGSMSGYIEGVKTNLLDFSKRLVSNDVDVRFAVVEYRDIFEDGEDSTKIKTFGATSNDIWTSDITQVETTLGALVADGGGDEPETPTDAMAKFYNIAMETYRPGASRFVFLLTDATAKGKSDDSRSIADDKKLPNMSDMIISYRTASIYTSVVSRLEYDDSTSYYYHEDYHNLYTETGGRYLDITSSNYGELMTEIAEWISERTDTDGDGLFDVWETEGVDVDGDGSFDVDLAAMGANPNSPDIFVYYDWMYKAPTTTAIFKIPLKSEINLKPSEAALSLVRQQFANHGINLHFIEGKTIPYQENFDLGKNYVNWSKVAEENFPRNYWRLARYCLFVNRYNNTYSSGIAEGIPGQFFIIANGLFIGDYDVDMMTAGTFMHELGHTLGLGHGGNNHDIYKPNYMSIMNYLYQFSGLVASNRNAQVNYSDYVLPSLDITAINEKNGLDPSSVTAKGDASGSKLTGAKWKLSRENNDKDFTNNTSGIAKAEIDLNQNGTIEPATNVDFYVEVWDETQNRYVVMRNSTKTVIPQSVNDWELITFKGGAIGGLGAIASDDTLSLISVDTSAIPDDLKEITMQEAEAANLFGNPGELAIKSINPDVIFAGYTMQNIRVVLANRFTSETKADLEVKSDAFSEAYTDTISLAGGDSTDIFIPVPSSVTTGTHSVDVKITCANGLVKTKSATFEAVDVEPVTVKEGEAISTEGTAFTTYQTVIEDTSIAEISGTSIKGLKAGQTFIILRDGNISVGNVPIYVTNSSNPGPQKSNSTPNTNTNPNSTTEDNNVTSSGSGCSMGFAGICLFSCAYFALRKKN